jgi:hypothetical protein
MAEGDAGYTVCGTANHEAFRLPGTKFTRRGGLTTFNILFKNKDDQFRTSAVDRPNG